jgi:hypothetical protein
MFQSKNRSIIIPQYEHENLAGTLANAWGNQAFEKPALDFDAFVQGVALHDWHYGVLDTVSIGSASETEWLAAVQKGVAHHFENPITDVVVKLHIRRLLKSHTTPDARAMTARLDQDITTRLAQTPYSRQEFERADRITHFCDAMAFSFSFGDLTAGQVDVYAHAGDSTLTTLTYQVQSGGKIRVQPWPFSTGMVSGIMLGYQADGYPHNLEPEVIRYWVEKTG